MLTKLQEADPLREYTREVIEAGKTGRCSDPAAFGLQPETDPSATGA